MNLISTPCFPKCIGSLSRSIGTFARALDCGSAIREPSLHLSAAAASRDITLVCKYLSCTSKGHFVLLFAILQQSSVDLHCVYTETTKPAFM